MFDLSNCGFEIFNKLVRVREKILIFIKLEEKKFVLWLNLSKKKISYLIPIPFPTNQPTNPIVHRWIKGVKSNKLN